MQVFTIILQTQIFLLFLVLCEMIPVICVQMEKFWFPIGEQDMIQMDILMIVNLHNLMQLRTHKLLAPIFKPFGKVLVVVTFGIGGCLYLYLSTHFF